MGDVKYEDAVAFLQTFQDMERGAQASAHPSMSLASMRSLLVRLQQPQHGRHTVHITGSKGKGSTAAMIEGILRRAGARTALYTSPHLHSYTERISIDGMAVSPQEFATALEAIRPAVDEEQQASDGAASTFGILTALFFWLVRAQAPAIDWQVVEVGLGGSYDATNVFDRPDIVVITPISLEHTHILGDTPAAIARDKAGIIKPGATCVLAPQTDPTVEPVVRQRCDDVGARLIDVGRLYETDILERYPFGQSFHVQGPARTRELRSPMLGRHQTENAATAVAVAEAIRERGHDIPEQAIIDGIARTRLLGRMEVMGQEPLIVADGAHNPASAAALAATLRDYFEWRKCYFVLGATRDKDIRGIGFKIAALAELIVCCKFDNPRSADPYAMIQEVGFLGPPAVAEDSVAGAIETAVSHAGPTDLVCITGSLYVVAEAREHLLGKSVAQP